MGDMDSSDSSWKKLVVAKVNKKWISTMSVAKARKEIPIETFKIEVIEDDEHEVNTNKEVEGITLTQELDPLSLLKPELRRRRRSPTGGPKESPNERASRLAKMSAYAAQRLANETPDQRANRLRRMSEYAAKRLAHETSEQRAKRLSRMSAYSAKRLATETSEQRQARLARMSAYAARRHAMKKSTSNSTELDSDDMYNQS